MKWPGLAGSVFDWHVLGSGAVVGMESAVGGVDGCLHACALVLQGLWFLSSVCRMCRCMSPACNCSTAAKKPQQ